MKHYIGLDVSMKETSICVVNEEGKVCYEGNAETDPQVIFEHIQKLNLAIEKVAIESGSISRWLVMNLQRIGLPAICVDARHMSAILSVNVNKTDKNDARGIANALRTGMYRHVDLKSDVDADICSVIAARKALVQERTKLKNVVRGLLKSYGIRIATVGKASFVKCVQECLRKLSYEVNTALEALLNAFRAIDEEIKKLELVIEEMTSKDEDVQLLMSIPGVGPLTALSFKAIIGKPERFKNSRSVGAYLGLTPQQYSSGEKEKLGRISKCGTTDMRALLYEAANVMLTRTKSWCRPKAWALKLQRKKGFKKAVTALGRKLAVIMHRMLVTKRSFELGDHEKKQEAEKAKKQKLAKVA